MEQSKVKNEGSYDKLLYQLLKSLVGKRCRLILKDGDKPEGSLNYVGIGIKDAPFIAFDMGDSRVTQRYNLNFDNILHVEEVK